MRTVLQSKRMVILLAAALFIFLSLSVAAAWTNATSQPRIEVLFSQYVTNGPFQLAVVKVRNHGRVAAVYQGYAKGTPLLDYRQRGDAREWQRRLVMCGTGLQEQVLLPGEELVAKTYVEAGKDWCAGLSYRKASVVDRVPAPLKFFGQWIPVKMNRETAWSAEVPSVPGE